MTVRVTAWLWLSDSPVGSTARLKEGVSLVKVSVWPTDVVTPVDDRPKFTAAVVALSTGVTPADVLITEV